MEGRFNGGFFVLQVWGAYIWRGLFSEFCGILLGASCYRIQVKIQPSWLPYSLSSSSAAAAALAGWITNVIKPQLVTSAKQY